MSIQLLIAALIIGLLALAAFVWVRRRALHSSRTLTDPASLAHEQLDITSTSMHAEDAEALASTQGNRSVDPTALLSLVLDLSKQARDASSLPQAMQAIGEALRPQLKASSCHCLRVDSWNGETALVRPWATPAQLAEDHIDPATMTIVRQDDAPLGQALVDKQSRFSLVEAATAGLPWRAVRPTQVLAVPVMVDNWPVALLEFTDPVPPTAEELAVLDMAASQLGFVAQRDNTQARIANDAEHLGRLGLVASRISSGVAVLDRHGEIEWINPMFVALTGWPHQRVLGRSLPDLLRTELQDNVQADQVTQFLSEGGPFRFAFESNRQNGSALTRYWGELDAILMLDEAGGRSQYVCLLNDITQRKQQEYQQAQEKEFLEALLGNLPISLIVSDPNDFSIAAINRYAELELGLKHDQVVKRRLVDVMGEAALRQAEPHMRHAIQSGEPADHDFIWWKDERKIVIHARHFALRHANGQPRLLITLAHDISQQQQARLDLEESERRFREMVESMDDCVYVATDRHDTFTYVSPAMPDMLGVSADALHNDKKAFESLVILEDRHMVDDRLLSVLAEARQSMDATSHDVVVRIQHPSRGIRWIRRRSRQRQLADGQTRVYGLMSDVTAEREQALELSRAKEQAEKASQAKSQFMASMSHEIRTPMNAILGMTELLLGTPLNDRQRRHAQVVYRSGETLLEIINDILDFSKIEAGHLELAPVEFSLQTLLDDALELMAPKAHEKGIEITAHFDPSLPLTVIADPLRLQQIITNLVSNAIKFTEHGEVVVTVTPGLNTVPVVDTTELAQTTNIEFHIRDTGIGIAQHVLPKLFSAFTQANAGLARRYGGTGLGLAITKQLVELMGGQITVKSALGIGSEFTFHIPVTLSQKAADINLLDDMEMPHLGILVVDDNATNRTVLENTLTAWGMHVVCAADGQEAFDYLMSADDEDLPIDMALVDMRMPRLDGFQFAEKLRGTGRYKDLRMILLSSTSDSDDVRRSQTLGYSRFLAKPLRKPELRQAILGVSADLVPPMAQLPSLKLTVLVIEDNAVNQEVCAQMLTRLGCRVHLASSAMEGLRKLCENCFDVVLLDIQMPGMDGEETLQQFRSTRISRFNFKTRPETPVVAVTAHVDEQRYLDLGFDAFLSKPYRLHQLARVLQACMKLAGLPLPVAQEDAALTGHAKQLPSSSPTALPELPQPTPLDMIPALPWREVFDEVSIQRLLELDPAGKNHLLERVTRMLSTSVDKYLHQLEDAWRAEDLKTIKDVVHTLKSSSANVGALKLSQCCVDIEHALKDPKQTDLVTLIVKLRDSARTVQAALPLLLEGHR